MEIRSLSSHDELREAFGPVGDAFGWEPGEDDLEHQRELVDPERFLVAILDGEIVGSAEALSFGLTVPGGEVPVGGLTTVAVKPTHRRRGVMSALIQRQLEEFRKRGEPLAALWASEGSIYGRFGFGLATLSCDIAVPRDHLRLPETAADVKARLASVEEAKDVLPPIYERARVGTPGTLVRPSAWWEHKVLAKPEYGGARDQGPLRRVVVSLDGKDEAYAIYRLNLEFAEGVPASTLRVIEAVGATPSATFELWRWLAGIDLVSTIQARRLPIDHPLVLALPELPRLRMRVGDGIWVRLVDVETALARRQLRGDRSVVVDLADEHCPWNAGAWRIGDRGVEPTDAEPDLRLGVAELGSVYLGGFTFAQLAAARRLEEIRPGAIGQADSLFRTDRAPWCPEVF
jgi:predicted acetyltransferase